MYDTNQNFGVQVLVLSVESKTLRNDVLSLINAMLVKDRAALPHIPIVMHTSSIPEEAPRLAVSAVFRLLEHVVVDLASFWEMEAVNQCGPQMLDALLPQIDERSSLIGSVYWLVVRLGM
jgi:hypothetical protein